VSKIGVVDANALARAARGQRKAKYFDPTCQLQDRLIESLNRDDEEPEADVELDEVGAAANP